jgi:hypothetical protein
MSTLEKLQAAQAKIEEAVELLEVTGDVDVERLAEEVRASAAFIDVLRGSRD